MLKAGELVQASAASDPLSIIGLIGTGTCCEVYNVRNLIEPCKKAALKVFKSEVEFARAHDAEALLLDLVLRSNGPCKNLVKTYSDFDHGEKPCLLQELLDIDLRQILILNQGEGVSHYLIQRFMLDILRGLQHLHKSGFVHADIKPPNLMWSPSESCIKIIDFSLSYHVQDTIAHKFQSSGYRAPEVVSWNAAILQNSPTRDPKRPTKSCDLWSVGCVVADLMAGSKVFTNAKLAEIDKQQKQGVTFPTQLTDLIHFLLRKFDRNLPESVLLGNLLERLWCVDMEERLSAEDALKHDFFKAAVSPPDFQDLGSMTSPVLRILNVVKTEDLENDSAYSDFVFRLTTECSKYGTIASFIVPKDGAGRDKVYVEYRDWNETHEAYSKLCHKEYRGHTIILTYFPYDAFLVQDYY